MENEVYNKEKILETNISLLKNQLKKDNIFLQTKFNSFTYYLYLFFPTKEKSNNNIELLLFINLLTDRIYLYSLNLIQISDGRDLLPYITYKFYNKINYKSNNIIELIEKINIFLSTLTEKNLSKTGRFYLGEIYDIDLISNLKYIYKFNCFHCDIIDGNYQDIPSLITISDDYFCLYEYGNIYNKNIKNEKNEFTLVFYANIKSIISFKKSMVGSIVTITFRKDLNDKNFTLKIMSDIDEDMDKIMDILIKKIENIGYRMNIYEKKKGNIPDINIEITEENIELYENRIKNEDNAESLKMLLQLYEKAIEYYSAINDKKYIEYNNKIKKILKNEKYSKLLD